MVYSLEVKALSSAPIRSNSSEMSLAERVGVPLNIMCSMKWDMPASEGDSSRLPTANQMPRVMERTESMGSDMTVMPLSSTVLR